MWVYSERSRVTNLMGQKLCWRSKPRGIQKTPYPWSLPLGISLGTNEDSGETPHFKPFLPFQALDIQVETFFTKCSGCNFDTIDFSSRLPWRMGYFSPGFGD